MTLRRKMGIQIMAMLVGLLVVSGTAFWGVDALREDYGLAAEENEQLRQIFEIGSHLATARTLLLLDHPDRARARSEVNVADGRFDLFIAGEKTAPSGAWKEAAAKAAIGDALHGAARQLAQKPELQTEEEVLAADSRAVNAAIAAISGLISSIRESIEAHQHSAVGKHHLTTRVVAVVSAAVVVSAIVLGLMQYRAVMLPLGALRRGVRKIAAGQFAQRLDKRGDEEFAELAEEFNRMAGELDGFYHTLEEKVASKSRELIRSERLASVGFLAAGVAHEINNPLGIISGYAEFSLEQLEQQKSLANGDSAASLVVAEDIEKSLRIICDEAFRCKDITAKLLSLARQGDEVRTPVRLIDVAEQVVAIVGGLREYRDRTVSLVADRDAAGRAASTVHAVDVEMKQILLNLTLNALEASPPGSGQVVLEVTRESEHVLATVRDNGRGMSPHTVERVFEPFFTDKRGSAESRAARSGGTGLGLSITHAIVHAHGGTVTAHSDGPGKGSRFVVRLPALHMTPV